MEQARDRTFDDGPRSARRRAPIMLSMHNASPIRRYVLLRHRDGAVTTPRWSMERIASAPRDAQASTAAQAPRANAARR
jgi:hypothetical protein